ncbi:hypothetical protein AB0I81_55240 [Nonomuraea sp. NPDC050404]|uniref:hypothetical protein n=1 Tax=Nonomuraea sp. NPDC050404 TaxID=3155783 RepID=UPI0033D3877C
MSNKARVAFALLAGYYLGRRRKLRMAAALAAAGLAGRAGGGGGGGLLGQALKSVTSSPEVGQITDRLRGELLQVGKAAAVAATGRQIESLSGKLHERAEALRVPGAKGSDRAEEQEEDAEEEDTEEEPEEEPEESEKAKRGPRVLRRTGRPRR